MITDTASETVRPDAAKAGSPTRQPQPRARAIPHDGSPPPDPDQSYGSEIVDRALSAGMARLTLGMSPAVLSMAYLDWLVHLAVSPGKQTQLVAKGLRKALRFGLYAAQSAVRPGDTPLHRAAPPGPPLRGPGLESLSL